MKTTKKQISRGLRKRIRNEKSRARSVSRTREEAEDYMRKRLKHIDPPLTFGYDRDKKEPST